MSPMAPCLKQFFDHRLGPDPAVVGVGAVEDLVEQEEDRRRSGGHVADHAQALDFGIEAGYALLQGVGGPHRRRDGKPGNVASGPRRPGPRQREHGVDAHGPQQRALARHIRAAHQEQLRLRPRRTSLLTRRRPRSTDAPVPWRPGKGRFPRLWERARRDAHRRSPPGSKGLELADGCQPAGDESPIARPPAFDHVGQMDREHQHEGEGRDELVQANRLPGIDKPGQPGDPLRGGPPAGVQAGTDFDESRAERTAGPRRSAAPEAEDPTRSARSRDWRSIPPFAAACLRSKKPWRTTTRRNQPMPVPKSEPTPRA